MRVLVTGARGFVGGRLGPRLVAAGHEGVELPRGVDVGDAAAVEKAVESEEPMAVGHLAARSFVPDSVMEPEATFRANYLGTRNVLESVRRHAPTARVLVVSSGHVYGKSSPCAPGFGEGAE